MFLVKGIGNLIFGSSSSGKAELVQVRGKFYEFQGSKRVCRFIDSTATVRRKQELFVYEFVISREGATADDEEDSPECSFQIDDQFELNRASIGETLGSKDKFEEVAFWWKHDSQVYAFELDTVGNVAKTADLLEAVVQQCTWEHINQRDWTATEATPVKPPRPAPPAASPSTPVRSDSSPAATRGSSTPSTPSVGTPSTTATPPYRLSPAATPSTLDGEVLARLSGDFFVYNASTGEFKLEEFRPGDGTCELVITEVDEFEFKLYVLRGYSKTVAIDQDITSDMNIRYSEEHNSVVWTYSAAEVLTAFSVIFPGGRSDLETMQKTMTRCLYEANYKEPFAKVKDEDRAFMMGALREEVEYMDIDDGYNERDKRDWVEDDEDEEEEYQLKRRSLGLSEPDEESDDEKENDGRMPESEKLGQSRPSIAPSEFMKGDKNSNLALCYSYDRTILTRGKQIGIFKEADNDLDIVTTIKSVRTPDGKFFTPRRIMLHQRDNDLLLLSEERNDRIYRMDLNRGQVVEEWGLHKDIDDLPVDHISGEHKYAQMDTTNTFIGLNSSQIFRMDPRLWSKNKAILDTDTKINQYSGRPMFNCAATTGTGDVVVASGKGELRLYNDISKRAKTQLPGLGDPILGIDVTEDGKWILATAKSYLLVVPTDPSGEQSGFKKSLGQNKPIPRKLQLKPEDKVRLGLKEVKFTAAHFDVEKGAQEQSIVTSTGRFIVTWNFRKVKQNKLDEYKIKEMRDTVVADQFKYAQDDKVVVMMPSDIRLATRK